MPKCKGIKSFSSTPCQDLFTLVLIKNDYMKIFLKPLLDYGIEALGVEPAKNVAKIANKNGFNTVN